MSTKNWILSLLTIVFIVSCSIRVNGQEKGVSNLGLERYTVKISAETLDDSGGITASGVPINKKQIITAAHFCNAALEGMIGMILKPELKMTFININGEKVTQDGGIIAAYDNKIDICVIERPEHGIPIPRKVNSNDDVKVGEKSYIVGAPYGIFPIITEGIVSMSTSTGFEDPPDYKLNDRLIISAPAAPGNSGGPVFNSDGHLIGILIAVFPKHNHIAYCVTIEDIINFTKDLP